MEVNLYDQPAQAQFMQTYVPVPFEELMQAGAMQQQRWEEMVKAEDALQSEFGNIQYLRNVTDVAGNVYETGIEKYAQEAVGEFQNKLENITTGIADKSSPEYRAAVRNLITDWRKASGPQGIFGRMASDVERYKGWRSGVEESEIGSKTHRGIYADMQMQNYLNKTKQGYTDFNIGAPILKDVDIPAKLNETLKNLNDEILSMPGISQDAMNQIRRQGYTTGVDPQRVAGIAANLIKQDTDIIEDIRAKGLSAGYRDEELTEYVNQSINNYASTMAAVYRKEDPNVSWATDELAIHAGKKQLDNEDAVFATRLNLPLPASKGFENYEQLNSTITERRNKVAELGTQAMNELSSTWALPEGSVVIDPKTGLLVAKEPLEGISYIDTGAPAEFTDVARLVHGYNMQIMQANKAANDADRLRRNVMNDPEVGWNDEYFSSQQYATSVKKAKDKAMSEFDRSASTGTVGSDIWLYIQETALGTKGKDATRKAYAEANYTNYMQDVDPRYKKMNAKLKEKSKPGSFTANAVNLPEEYFDYLNSTLYKTVTSRDIKWADVTEGTEDMHEEERKNLIIKSKEKPSAIGPYYDQITGTIRVLYAIKTEDNEMKTFSTDMPVGMEEELYKAGLFDEYTSIVYTGLYNQLGAANNIAGTGVLTLPGDLNVEYLGRNNTGQYIVNIPVDDGISKQPVLQVAGFNTQGEMINTLTTLSKAEVAKKIQQEQENN